MNQKCPNCGLPWEKKLIDNYKLQLPKDCPGCKKLAPRQSRRPMNPIRKSKQK